MIAGDANVTELALRSRRDRDGDDGLVERLSPAISREISTVAFIYSCNREKIIGELIKLNQNRRSYVYIILIGLLTGMIKVYLRYPLLSDSSSTSSSSSWRRGAGPAASTISTEAAGTAGLEMAAVAESVTASLGACAGATGAGVVSGDDTGESSFAPRRVIS
jgi:hypothetical protein